MLIDSVLAAGQKDSYVFSYEPAPAANDSTAAPTAGASKHGCTVPGSTAGYSVTADPAVQGTTGQRSFYTDANGTIRYDTNDRATPDSEPVP